LKKNQLILGLVVLAILVGLAIYAQHRHPFDFHAFGEQFKRADWIRIGIAAGCIYLGYVIRAIRWALLLRPNKKVPLLSLLGTQVIGFTAVALIGRVADLVRPYLVAKKTGLPLSTQVAVYIVERLFDLGSTALIFSSVIALAPKGSLPHQEVFNKVSLWGLAGTAIGVLFLVAVRLSGEAVAGALEWSFGVFSKKLGQAMGEKVRTFRTGLNTLRNFSDLLVTLVLSLSMWGLITMAYLETARAFVASPQLALMSLPQVMVLLGSSGVASIFQLPVLGWFTQIGAVEETLRNLYGVAPEQAMACAATLLAVTFLCIVPVGLIWAQFSNLSIRKIAVESEHAGEEAEAVAAEEPGQV
jgi:glycosyltransferase 2 family protein